MKKFLVIYLICVMFLVGGCSNTKVSYEQNNNIIEQNSTNGLEEGNQEERVEEDKLSNVKCFVENYNQVATNDIEELIEIDIQSQEYYRTEFRLGAYQNAPAMCGKIGDNSIEIINSNYGGIFGSDLRIYASSNSEELTTEIFETFCKVCDDTITQEDIDEFYNYNDLFSGDCRIVVKGISGRVSKEDEGYEILLDAPFGYLNN